MSSRTKANKSQDVTAYIDFASQKAVHSVLSDHGLTEKDIIRSLFQFIAHTKTLPFQVKHTSPKKIPKTTKKTFSQKWDGKFISNKKLPEDDDRLEYLLKKHE